MAKYKYTGSIDRVFPSLGLTLKSGDEFDAPDNFIAVNVEKVGSNAHQYTKKKAEQEPEPISVEETEQVQESE